MDPEGGNKFNDDRHEIMYSALDHITELLSSHLLRDKDGNIVNQDIKDGLSVVHLDVAVTTSTGSIKGKAQEKTGSIVVETNTLEPISFKQTLADVYANGFQVEDDGKREFKLTVSLVYDENRGGFRPRTLNFGKKNKKFVKIIPNPEMPILKGIEPSAKIVRNNFSTRSPFEPSSTITQDLSDESF